MSQVYFAPTVKEDGTLVIPAFAMKGLGYQPGDSVRLSVPVERPDCGFDCLSDELFLGRSCADTICSGYTSDSADLNIPARLFAMADVPAGSEVTIFAGDRALVLVAGSEEQAELPEAIEDLLGELGLDVEVSVPMVNGL